jgi:YbbR domain-containing protein
VTLDDRVEDYFSVVPKIVGEPGSGYILGESQLGVEKVLVGGAETVVGSIRSVVAEVDVSGEQSEIKKTVELKAINESGESLKNIYIEPKTIDVTVPIMQSADVRTVGVKIQTNGSPAAGYFVKTLVADPSTVILRGPREKIQAIEYIETEPINLSGLTATVEKGVPLVLPEGVTSEGQETVTVRIELDGNQVSQSVRGIFEFKNLAGGRALEKFSPANALVTVAGAADKISSLTETDVRVIVDLAGKGVGTYTMNLAVGNVRVPDQVNVVNLETKQIEVIIK